MLGELFNFPQNTMAIGRLDQDSEGLLLLTTDGKTSEKVRSKKVEKEYLVQVDGLIDQESLVKLESGVEIGIHGKKYFTNPCKAFFLNSSPEFPERGKQIRDERHGPTSWISVVITEGKFRQVRKMTAAVGFPTLRLVRVRIGCEVLAGLKPGQVKPVAKFLMNEEPTS